MKRTTTIGPQQLIFLLRDENANVLTRIALVAIFFYQFLGASFSQSCLPNGIIFSTQEQLDNFPISYPTCTEIIGPVYIIESNPSAITDLSGLSNIEKVGLLSINTNSALVSLSGLNSLDTASTLFILNNSGLLSINGLNNLKYASTLIIRNNNQLANLDSLNNLNIIVNSLEIADNNSLQSISGLENLTNIGQDFDIKNNSSLINLSGLENLSTIGRYLFINNNSSLSSLDGTNNLIWVGSGPNIGGGVTISNNSLLAVADGFQNLSKINGTLQFNDNPELLSIVNFNSLSSTINLYFFRNQKLESIQGLNAIDSITGLLAFATNPSLYDLSGIHDLSIDTLGSLFISGNDALTSCEIQMVCDYLESPPPNSALISNNGTGCNSIQEVESACSALPVEMIHFDVRKQDNKALLTWSTATEINNRGFEVQHSTTARLWKNVGWLEGKNTSENTSDYLFIHDDPQPGKNYYRLNQIDYDGQYEYSEIRNVAFESNNNHEFYPNPASHTLYFSEVANFTISDLNGKTIIRGRGVEADISSLASGVYFIKTGKQVKRFLKL